MKVGGRISGTNQFQFLGISESLSLFFELFKNISLWEGSVVLKRNVFVVFVALPQALSPRILCANLISFGIMVTRLACMVHKLVSSNNKMRYASATSCNAVIAAGDILNTCPPCHRSCTNSLTR